MMLGCNVALEDYISFSLNTKPIINWPQNDTAMSALCTKVDDFRQCLDGHLKAEGANCTADELLFYRQLLAVQTNYFKSTCITAKRRADALHRMSQCYSLPEVNAGLFRTAFRAMVMYSTEGNSRIKAAQCCAALYFRDTIYQVNQGACPAEITEEVHHMVQEMIGPAYHKECGPVATYKKCYEGLPASIQKIFKEAEVAEPPFNKNL